jgi:hypothetical protein
LANGHLFGGSAGLNNNQQENSSRLNTITCKVTVSREVTVENLVSRAAIGFSKILRLMDLMF